MLAKTDALKKVSGFNEVYFLYFEDFDLSLRISELEPSIICLKCVYCTLEEFLSKRSKHIGMFFRSAITFLNQWLEALLVLGVLII